MLESLFHRCFPVKFTKFFRTPFFTEHLQWPLLILVITVKIKQIIIIIIIMIILTVLILVIVVMIITLIITIIIAIINHTPHITYTFRQIFH